MINLIEEEPKGKDMYLCYFSPTDKQDIHKCKMCANHLRKQNLVHGYQNLFLHVRHSHNDYKAVIKSFLKGGEAVYGPLDSMLHHPTEKAKGIHKWISWIIDDNLPFTFCEKQSTRRNTVLPKISIPSLKKYMKLLQEEVTKTITKMLPTTFGLLIDGWTTESYHFSAIFATFMDEKTNNPVQLLLSCNVADDFDENTEFEENLAVHDMSYGFTADDWFDIIIDALHLHGRTEVNAYNFKNTIEFIVGDNCSTNRSLATKSEVPLVGCANHRLHLAVCQLIGKEEKRNKRGVIIQHEDGYRPVIRQVDQLMGKLRQLKNSSLLRVETDLLPERKNATRWSSMFSMLLKWTRIREAVSKINWIDVSVLPLIVNPTDNAKINALIDDLKKCEGISKMLQTGGSQQMDLYECRALFKGLIDSLGDKYSLSHIKVGSSVVNNPHFENGIVKIQGGSESDLTNPEKDAVKIFMIATDEPIGTPGTIGMGTTVGFAENLLLNAQQNKRQKVSIYRSTRHCTCTSNVCERLFSLAKLLLSPLRKSMSPDTLNMLLVLKANKQLWTDARIIQIILDTLKTDAKSNDMAIAANAVQRAAQATLNLEEDDRIGEEGLDNDILPDLDGFTY